MALVDESTKAVAIYSNAINGQDSFIVLSAWKMSSYFTLYVKNGNDPSLFLLTRNKSTLPPLLYMLRPLDNGI